MSEKFADRFGIALKYGGGPAKIRQILDGCASLVGGLEKWESEFGQHPEHQAITDKYRELLKLLAIEVREQA